MDGRPRTETDLQPRDDSRTAVGDGAKRLRDTLLSTSSLSSVDIMSTQRPFFANFFSAFRARSTPGPFQAKSSTTTGAISPSVLTATAHISTQSTTATATSAPRSVAAKTPAEGTHPSQTSAQSGKTTSTSPFATTTLSSSPGTTFYRRPPSPSPSHNLGKSPTGHNTPPQMPRGRQRRDSGSSNTSGGFMDAMGAEKWYIGGRTATGEERFYQLGLVTNTAGKRVRSLDRLSL